jgi:signal transduction histidine kinase/DNA-binding response OmpR family regulator
MQANPAEPRQDRSIQTRMLIIILPLIAAPMLILAAVGFFTASREADKSSSRYLSQREADLRAVAENPAIPSYFNNTRYGLSEEAEIARQELERSLKRFVERSNRRDKVYWRARFLDADGAEVAHAVDSAAPDALRGAGAESYFSDVKALAAGETWLSPLGPTMLYAMPVYQLREGQAPTVMGVVALDFSYPVKEFRRTTAVILRTFVIITAVSLGVALLLTVLRVRQFTSPVRQLAEATHRLAAGERSIRVTSTSRDEIGQLASAFNTMAARLEADEAAIRRKVVETRTLYEVAQEVTAQVDLEPTLKLIVDRARDLLDGEVGLLALRQGDTDTFTIQAHSGPVTEAVAQINVRGGEGLIGRVAQSGRAAIVQDYLDEFRASPFLRIAEEAGLRSQVAVPLRARDVVTGVLLVTSPEAAKFDEEDRQLLSALADHASIAIENARLLAQVRRHAGELEARVEMRTRELQDANRRLEEASRHKSEFLANMSHELRTPLNAIIGFTRLVQRRTQDILPEKQRENLEKILISSDHLLRLINDILDLSKIEAGRMEVRPVPVDLRQIVDACLRTVEPLVKSDRLRLVQAIPSDLPVLFSDGEKLKQILINLLSNAVKFTEAGTVTVSARRDADTVSVSVSDTGIGIPEHALELIFEEFRQVDSSSTRKYGGTGLGLSISRHLARLLGGDIAVQSKAGAGSTFILTIPARFRASAAPVPSASPAQPAPTPENSQLVLTIDDDPDVVHLLSENLSEAGYRVVGALSGEDGLQKARELKPFAITLDIMMPGTDGWQVLHDLKADPVTRDVPVIVVSVVDSKDLGYRLGAFDYLLKPLDRDAILGALARIRRHRGLLLVVDDDPSVPDMVRQLLEGEPYEIVAAGDGEQALAAISRAPPNVILLDLLMPRMDGFELLERLKADERLRHIPVVVLTVKDLSATERAHLQQSVLAVIEKRGLDREALIHELSAALQTYRPQPQQG